MKQSFFSEDEYIELMKYLYSKGIECRIENIDNLKYIEKMTEYILYESDTFKQFREFIKPMIFSEIENQIKNEIKCKKPKFKAESIMNIQTQETFKRPPSIFTIDSMSSIDTQIFEEE